CARRAGDYYGSSFLFDYW
nr:immunoglobulin heavy chain junction region [Mus musculus]MBK4185924.1 immunoglobulin heavy chain junction region [Mus musculus]MBK4185925.1 immunoglobulin heavy chain junction region [Mus musculus]MBK4185926.1 immunoglobulin heavy chain junction region [Mus musculus]MBK4185927.1 immunoglobulin heavy chain junction region [Mus musculus]